jgi:hypothetical protein
MEMPGGSAATQMPGGTRVPQTPPEAFQATTTAATTWRWKAKWHKRRDPAALARKVVGLVRWAGPKTPADIALNLRVPVHVVLSLPGVSNERLWLDHAGLMHARPKRS